MNQQKIVPFKLSRAVIEISGGCNYTCQMCPQTTGRGKDWLKKMSITDFKRIVEEIAESGCEVINLDGSGEVTLMKNLPEFVNVIREHGIKSFFFTNGFRLKGNYMKEVVDAGLDLARFSVIGYDQIKYMEWMAKDAFHTILENAIEMREYIKASNSNCLTASYHLITDNDRKDFEVEQYINNFIKPAQTEAEIWMMHNWSGVYDVDYKRKGKKRSCGRPFSPDIVIRAGGSNGGKLSVAPCCQTLGNDAAADLGSVDGKTVAEVWNGERYQWLRQMHMEERFDEVDFCKNCDFLYEDPEVLVWTNSNLVDIDKMKGTSFTLEDYKYE